MSAEPILVVIDDNRRSSHDLKVQLTFIGETPVMTTAWDWEQLKDEVDKHGEVYGVIVGQCEEQSLSELIKDIHHWNATLPIICINDQDKELKCPDESRKKVLELLKSDINVQNLSQALDDARRISGLVKPAIQKKLNNSAEKILFRSLVGKSSVMEELRGLMNQVADKMVNVMILGESGTGKEVMARNLHYHSGLAEQNFIMINCPAHSSERLAAEIFGVEKGANDSKEIQLGALEKAIDGTLFLDEVADLSMELQGKVANFLENRSFERIEGTESLQSNVRIIASTNQNLEEKISQGKFREDLYYRLSVVPIQIPSLREHIEDIPELVDELLARLEHKENLSMRFNSTALLSLQRHKWPGNVRELSNLVERLSLFNSNEILGVNDLPQEYQHIGAAEMARIQKTSGSLDNNEGGSENSLGQQIVRMKNFASLTEKNLTQYLANFEKQLIQVALLDGAGGIAFTAERLEINQEDLAEKMKLYQLV